MRQYPGLKFAKFETYVTLDEYVLDTLTLIRPLMTPGILAIRVPIHLKTTLRMKVILQKC